MKTSQSRSVSGAYPSRFAAERTALCAGWSDGAGVRSIRMGPFETDAIRMEGYETFRVEEIRGRWFAYVTIDD